MSYRVTYGPVYTIRDCLADAQDVAMTEARALTRACGFPVTARVHRLGRAARDELGRDVTTVELVGSAVGVIEHRQARVRWEPAGRDRVEPLRRYIGGEAVGGPVMIPLRGTVR
ncbi:MAG: hypothetical protein JJU07_16420 [Natronohydrobacter sp.]|nr:hypothetical protein [Natronohydrobacter sp.]